MKISLSIGAVLSASLIAGTQAFPHFANRAEAFGDGLKSEDSELTKAWLKKIDEFKAGGGDYEKRADSNGGGRKLTALINPANFKFNADEQLVDIYSEAHRFQPPGPNDIRGPCPGLNLLANHGYLNRNGVTTLTQGIDAINRVFGVGYDLALALNAYAVVFNGNLLDLTWSIGGPYGSSGLGAITNLLTNSEPKGINAHNIYEGDASIVRQDYYAPGANHDNVHVYLPYFEDLLKLGGNDATEGKDVYNAELMLQHKANRWHESVATNPLFFNSAFGGLVVTTAAERFVAEFAANNTADENGYNRIYLDEKNLLAFFSVTKDANGKLTYTPGHERLLDGWYRRPLAAQFGLEDIVLTLLNAAKIDPSLLSVGGNAGQVNTFTGVNVGDLTGGVYNLETLLNNPQALSCYLYQIGVEELIPTQLGGLYKVLGTVLDFVGKNIAGPWKKVATAGNNPCDSFNSNIKEAYAKYPGSKIE
ncbi:hypothetical protein IE53DRAFT_52592 [Violaceomyces palustris]|uniref:Uncharacterized protein n=1 Tax=Violaceomyces palustris TaxID=1673888 RepID=A0ACD0NZR5_9BASI|nr:hypothetical protein IE53DRAFT_52592 [Violaceomyces palustris]